MARRKNPENETDNQRNTRQHLDAVADSATRSEKVSWNRKMDAMVKLLSTLRPIEEQIADLMGQKWPIFDEISDLRTTMVSECVHPFEYLVHHNDHITCKFCEKRISIKHEQP